MGAPDAFIPMGSRTVLLFADAASRRTFVRQLLAGTTGGDERLVPLVALGRAGYVGRQPTLLSGLKVIDNLRFPISYHQPEKAGGIEARLVSLCAGAGIDRKLLSREVRSRDAVEALQGAFLQAVLQEPELLVLDGVFEDLDPEEQRAVARLGEAFQRVYPLRRVVYLAYEIPAPLLFETTQAGGMEAIARTEVPLISRMGGPA